MIEHALAVAKLADVVVSHYNVLYFDNKINRDIVVFTAMFHDIGKVLEYDFISPDISTTTQGELLGHIYLGAKKIEELA
ncbi:MAG: HD domain-containing protein [bacterium]|nr:HD domain-containing protein [bacterium]